MNVLPELRCLAHGFPLAPDPGPTVDESIALTCGGGCRVPVIGGIPRFTVSESYAAGFGLQWAAHARTQLDSVSGTHISRDRLVRCLGGTLDAVAGRSVLEVGCGAGRFTEVLLDAGARVFACDLSKAVEANYANCRGHRAYFVCQADLMRLPIAPASFHLMPESRTAIVTSGRPVVICQARSTLMPVTPNNSAGSASTAGSPAFS